jgi:CBS domain-containing protein
MLKASQLIERNLPRLDPNAPIGVGIGALASTLFPALPVVDADGIFFGLLRDRDVMPILLGRSVHERAIAEFACRRVVTFSPDDSVLEICNCLLSGAVVDCPVVGVAGHFLGMLLPKALVDLAARLRTGTPERVLAARRATSPSLLCSDST